MLIPIRTETPIRRTPLGNYVLLGLNIVLFVALHMVPSPTMQSFNQTYFVLDGLAPRWFQFITYQFSHADPWHLGGNMLFLWVFGNSVNAKMGDWRYVLFYLSSGVFAALMFTLGSDHSLLGASGSIAAVTTAYLVLFPRSRVTILYWFFFIGVIELPAMALIIIKVIIWDNIVSPQIGGGASMVAYSAHLAGYFFGFVVALVLLAVRVIPRDQFDLLAVVKRWNQRRTYAESLRQQEARRTPIGVSAATGAAPSRADRAHEARMNQLAQIRSRIAEHLSEGELKAATALYEQLTALDDQQCLPAEQQIQIGREYYANSQFAQAASAFERFLNCYRNGAQSDEVRLLLGIILARDLKQYESAEGHLKRALDRASTSVRREQAQRWLDHIHEQRHPNVRQ